MIGSTNSLIDSDIRAWNDYFVDRNGNVYTNLNNLRASKPALIKNGMLRVPYSSIADSGEIIRKLRNVPVSLIVYEAWNNRKLEAEEIITYQDNNPSNIVFDNLFAEKTATWHGLHVSYSGDVYRFNGIYNKHLTPTSGGGIHYYEPDSDSLQLRCLKRERIVYEAWTGDVLTPSDLIIFKDGNSGNCCPDNLERISLSQYRDESDKHRHKKLSGEEWNYIRDMYEKAQIDPAFKKKNGISFRYFSKLPRRDANGNIIYKANGEPELLCSLSTVQKVLAVDSSGNYLYSYDGTYPKQN